MKSTVAGSVMLLLDAITGGVALLNSGGCDSWGQLALLIPGGLGAAVALQRCVHHLFTGGTDAFDFAEWELQRRLPTSD